MIPTTLAIDFGTVRIGLAVSRATLADPLEIIPNDETVFTRIKKILSEENIEQIVVGLSEQEMAEKSRGFAAELAKHTDLPIFFTDETLSSKTVHEKLQTAKKSKRSGHIDHFAAAEFLQQWIDNQEAGV
ncbi:MAG: Holliday junction resolvase RuvX [Pseudomonadales bacterium]|nr:Holliday junction resolvase RuvX [Candidatus Woesebacteria bacterium]MCB9801255.1 Holliday junction resolvase RuvX [Pseudomonadales bacterium]